MNLKLLTVAAAALSVSLAGGAADATVLLSLTDPAIQTGTSYSLDFTATSTSSVLSIAGYQVPSYEQFTDNSVTTGGGANLLGPS